MKVKIKTKNNSWENLSKFDILRFFENEIDRFQKIIGYTEIENSCMKSNVALMISEGKVNSSTISDEKFINQLLINIKTK